MTASAGFEHVGDLDALVRALTARGETIVQGPQTLAVATIQGHESKVQLIWRAETQTLHLVEVLPMLIAPERTNDVISLVTFANAKLAMPAWQLRKMPDGWKIAYSVCAFLDHEGKISTRVVTKLLEAVRLAVRESLDLAWSLVGATPAAPAVVAGDPAAFIAAVGRAREKLGALAKPMGPALTADERARLATACERDLPRFAGRVASATSTDAGAPFFSRVRVLRLESPQPYPAQVAFGAVSPTNAWILTGNPGALSSICAEEPPAHVTDPDLAFVLANVAGLWTGASLLSEIRLSSVDDIPFRRASADDQAREAEVRRTFTSQITPPSLERIGDGIRTTMWIASEARLRRRVAEVQPTKVSVTENVMAELPIFPGNQWRDVGGRLVPVA